MEVIHYCRDQARSPLLPKRNGIQVCNYHEHTGSGENAVPLLEGDVAHRRRLLSQVSKKADGEEARGLGRL